MKRSLIKHVWYPALAALTLMGCGQQEFIKQDFVNLPATGSRYLPGKVDILIVTDNSPSINVAYSTIQNQLVGFTNSLRNQHWDYHVAKINMWYPADINKVLVNPDYNAPTLPDGSPNIAGQIVPAGAAVTSASQFQLMDGIVNVGSKDPTYASLLDKLRAAQFDSSSPEPRVNFLRPDALLAVIVITNGIDQLQSNGFADRLTSEERGVLSGVAQQLIDLKGSKQLVRFYPVASSGYYDGANRHCLVSGGKAMNGLAYLDMLRYGLLDGLSTNFCDASALQTVMARIDENLTKVRQDYVYSAIVLNELPIPESIRVFKGSIELPQSEVDGWSFDPTAGPNGDGIETVYTITAVKDSVTGEILPIEPGLGLQTGYVIRLNGSGVMSGSDAPRVEYRKP